MENTGEQSGEEAPIYSDSYLLPILEELYPAESDVPFTFFTFSLFTVVEELIKRATATIEQGSKNALFEGVNNGAHVPQRYDEIGSLSSQMTSEILNGNDTHTITLKVLKHVSNLGFGLEETVVRAFAAFALTFGDFWLLVRIYADNVVNEPMTTDHRESELTSTNKEAYINQIKANNEFIKILLNSLRYLFDIINTEFGFFDMPTDRARIVVYWIVRCAIVAATQIIALSKRGLDHRYLVRIRSPTEIEKLTSLNEDLMHTLSKGKECQREREKFRTKLLNQDDIVEYMRVIITDEDMPPLYHGEKKKMEHLNVLKGKRVLLLISGIDIASEDIASLKHVSIDPRKDEIVWIPIINDRSIAENQLKTLQNSMPWYSVRQPSMVRQDALDLFKGIRDFFKGWPKLLIRSPSGSVLKNDAIPIVRIWQNLSVDNLINGDMERQLWEKETWNLKLLVNDVIDPIVQQWVKDERYILMYGSNDINWIRNFIKQARSIACNLLVHIEMVYMGNSHNENHGCKVQDAIMSEKLSHCLPESSRAYFWSRINSMIKSKEKLNDPSDKVLQEIQRFKSHEEWVLLAKGSTIIGHVSGQNALSALEEVQKLRTTLFKS
ncbi:protein SIEVE ELEMENT OCCLUSION B-like [Silene latifolia]|uniref:protein SIEVE ELEMENT OCCLUSION B-like n=1 Tax=Silene latifolia TaxID=37657 RepID=UPI003D777960